MQEHFSIGGRRREISKQRLQRRNELICASSGKAARGEPLTSPKTHYTHTYTPTPTHPTPWVQVISVWLIWRKFNVTCDFIPHSLHISGTGEVGCISKIPGDFSFSFFSSFMVEFKFGFLMCGQSRVSCSRSLSITTASLSTSPATIFCWLSFKKKKSSPQSVAP